MTACMTITPQVYEYISPGRPWSPTAVRSTLDLHRRSAANWLKWVSSGWMVSKVNTPWSQTEGLHQHHTGLHQPLHMWAKSMHSSSCDTERSECVSSSTRDTDHTCLARMEKWTAWCSSNYSPLIVLAQGSRTIWNPCLLNVSEQHQPQRTE